ncbi:zinc finger protein 2-like [Thalassophryne amazonica]|uniref:zinc finger protein 2-like n=1 Tax=Thalassophryne amazonica TaxID=390379 RepID=UPI0014723D0C|nr:zinc finger protein 2-like [Thalassophryne amazonica]
MSSLLFVTGGEPGSDPQISSDMEVLRTLVNRSLTTAVDEILDVFGKTLLQYREQIEQQRRQLDTLRAADQLQISSWIKPCPEDQILSVAVEQTEITDEADVHHSALKIKTEDCEGSCSASQPDSNSDPHYGPESASDIGLLTDRSEPEDRGDWKEAHGLWKSVEPAEAEGQSSLSSSAEESSFSCKVCGELYHRRQYLLSHAQTHFSDCGVCGEHVVHGENLRQHLKVHKQTHSCNVCGQSFTLRSNLTMHTRIHTGERPYGCTVCNKRFSRKASLVRHVRSHTGEKPHICTHCGRSFVEKGNLTVHLRLHTGEKPYNCMTCGGRFSQLSGYNKHPCQKRHKDPK